MSFALCLDDSSNDSTLASEKSSRALSSGHWCEGSDNGDAPYKTFLWCEGLTRWPSCSAKMVAQAQIQPSN